MALTSSKASVFPRESCTCQHSGIEAVRNASSHFLPLIKASSVKIMTNNVACMFYINRQGGACSPSLCAEAVKLWSWRITNHIAILASYLHGIQNVTANHLSRHFSQLQLGVGFMSPPEYISNLGTFRGGSFCYCHQCKV